VRTCYLFNILGQNLYRIVRSVKSKCITMVLELIPYCNVNQLFSDFSSTNFMIYIHVVVCMNCLYTKRWRHVTLLFHCLPPSYYIGLEKYHNDQKPSNPDDSQTLITLLTLPLNLKHIYHINPALKKRANQRHPP
jgi:hypothetical protein